MRPASRKPLGAAVGAAIGALILATSLSSPFGLVLAQTPNDGKEITYNISFGAARAYAYQASVSPSVIAAAGTQDKERSDFIQACRDLFSGAEEEECIKQAPPPGCVPQSKDDPNDMRDDPFLDPYECDSALYNQTPNCPAPIAIGSDGPLRFTATPPGATPNDKVTNVLPPDPSPVKVNELVTMVQAFTRSGVVFLSSGLASAGYTDAAGRDDPEAHAESDGFNPLRLWQERCWAGTEREKTVNPGAPEESFPEKPKAINPEGDYSHVYTRSGPGPDTYQLSECREGRCTFGGTDSSGQEKRFSAERAETVTWIHEEKGKLKAHLSAFLEGFKFADGNLTADSLFTMITLESDGTPAGIKWSVITRSSNVRIDGEPQPLPSGSDPQNGTIKETGQTYTVGMATPIVQIGPNGSSASIKAPGMVIGISGTTASAPDPDGPGPLTANSQPLEGETAYLGGAEFAVTLGRETPFSFLATNFATDTFFGSAGGFEVTTGAPLTGSTVSDEGRVVSIRELSVMPWPLISIFSFGTLALLVLLAGWLRRFAWGRQMFRHQPLRTIDWLYRAFVRT